MAGQTVQPMLLLKTRYEVRLGETVDLPADAATLDFLLNARSRRVTMGDQDVPGLVVSTNASKDQILLAPTSRMEPGDYAVTVSGTSASGEVRETNVTVSVEPRAGIPKGSTRPPVVLLNGWQQGVFGSCPFTTDVSTFGNLATYLRNDGVPQVYLFDNCREGAGDEPIESLGADLGAFLQTIKFDDGTQVQQIDLVGFSLGGLIARSYLSGLQLAGGYAPPTNTLVRKLVLIATPNFGSFLAGNVSGGLANDPQASELVPGSAFLWNVATWNQRGDDLHGVDAIAVIGNAGTYTNLQSNQTVLNGSDGLVSTTSASIGFVSQKASLTRIVPYCHVDPGVFTNTNLGTFDCNAAGIANVTSTSQTTGQIVRSFLAGDTAWSTLGTTPDVDSKLATNGATFFAMQNKSGGYVKDMSQVVWGNVQLINGGNTETIFYTDFVTGSGNYTATSSSLGAINCGTLTATAGYTAATRCKIATAIVSVGPLSTAVGGRAVTAGSAITLTGVFGSKCSNCTVTATPAGSTTATALTINSWSADGKTIVAQLPSSLTGYLTLWVNSGPGNDFIGVWSVSSTTVTATPASLSFAYTIGGAVPDTQTITIGGGLAWTASVTNSSPWISLSATSGTAPSSLVVTAMPTILGPGTYNDTIQISAAGASNSPQSVGVTLVITGAPAALTVAPQSLGFEFTVGGSVPASKTLSITNSGSGNLAWTAVSSDYWVAISPSTGNAPATLTVSVAPQNLAAGSHTANITITPTDSTVSPVTIAVTLTVTGSLPVPAITAVASAATYAPAIASATWVAIFGTNLSQAPYTWQASDIVNGALPTSLQGVSVTINGVAAYISYISPSQINVLAPDDTAIGPVPVIVSVGGQASGAFSVQKNGVAPGFLTFDGTYAIAQHLPDYGLVGKPNLVSYATTTPAKPGEALVLYGTGFGPTDPPQPTGQVGTAPLPAGSVQITFGGTQAQVSYGGLAGPGLYQFNVIVPTTLADGDAAVVATVAGVSSPLSKAAITVQH